MRLQVASVRGQGGAAAPRRAEDPLQKSSCGPGLSPSVGAGRTLAPRPAWRRERTLTLTPTHSFTHAHIYRDCTQSPG